MDFTLNRKEEYGISVSENESEAVLIAVSNLKQDIRKTVGAVVTDTKDPSIVIRTQKKGTERFTLKAADGVLYITGESRRGTVYGIYTLSEMLGVSPWYYFGDVPVKERDGFSLPEGYELTDAPTVPYRGIFINDEEELDKWARLHMNEPTIGVHTYKKVFELILRLKGNYIWPAMHVNSFNIKKENGDLANRMGLVVGTSHCDMLMRSNYREWEPWIEKKGYKGAKYDYSIEGRNREILKEYWRESAEQNKDVEVSYTLGMRGIHDSGFITEALTADSEEELKDKKVKLLEQVINDQKEILNDVLKRPCLTTFVPYKEVLNLYDRGLKVPEDVTLIWTNDNYGYVRRYPSEKEQKRPGGNGIYYHNSYWAPTLRHYLFISSYPIAQTRYEMGKAYENGIRKLWVCNMGALKPLEQEMEYFLRLGWDYGKENAKVNDPEEYLADWIDRNFTGGIGKATAKLLNRYARVSNTRKVEMMEENVFSQCSVHNEAAIRLNTLKELYAEGNRIRSALPAVEKESFFELVLMKIHAAYYTAAMFYFADRSHYCFIKGRHGASREYTKLSKGFEDMRRAMLKYYNKEMCGGKWDGILTPESFPPPRTSMHPASVPSLAQEKGPKDRDDCPVTGDEGIRPFAVSIDATAGKLEASKIIKGLGRGTVDLLELGSNGAGTYSFSVDTEGDYYAEIYRYPSLDSVGDIQYEVAVDGGKPSVYTAESNDEWRGNWTQNVMDNTDRLRVSLGVLAKGEHTVTVTGKHRYFAFSKIVIFKDPEFKDNLGVILPNIGDYAGEELPGESYLTEARKVFYGFDAPEYVIPVGSYVNGRNVSDATDRTEYSDKERRIFMPDARLTAAELLSFGSEPFAEKEGAIAIEAFAAFNNTEHAFCSGPWEYASGVSYHRDNLALWIRGRGRRFTEADAPALNYRISAKGGDYRVYVLMKFNENGTSRVSISLDGKKLESAWDKESPWRYEGEQPFRYVPMLDTHIEDGEHVLSLKIYASGIRIERIVLWKL